jgi:hypothetical protein
VFGEVLLHVPFDKNALTASGSLDKQTTLFRLGRMAEKAPKQKKEKPPKVAKTWDKALGFYKSRKNFVLEENFQLLEFTGTSRPNKILLAGENPKT